VAVEVLAGPVVPHGCPRVGVAGGDLDIPQIHARIEHGGDEGVAEHVRVRPRDRHAPSLCQAAQAAGGVAIHPGAAAVEQDRPAGSGTGRLVDGPPHGWWERDENHLGAFAAYTQHPVTVLLAQIA
jgi:hypothetical protein